MKKSCFAYSNNGCLALKVELCKDGKPCPFYKAKEQLEVEHYKALYRAQKLGLKIDIDSPYIENKGD